LGVLNQVSVERENDSKEPLDLVAINKPPPSAAISMIRTFLIQINDLLTLLYT
jgi:hypothetical protein